MHLTAASIQLLPREITVKALVPQLYFPFLIISCVKLKFYDTFVNFILFERISSPEHYFNIHDGNWEMYCKYM